jgi:hypothetical protein
VRKHAEGNAMTKEIRHPDMRDAHITDATRATEKENRDAAFIRAKKPPLADSQNAATDASASPNKQ